MNANEVIANRALEVLGHARGDYAACHPNNHVNLAQSTNDVYPTALRIAAILATLAFWHDPCIHRIGFMVHLFYIETSLLP